MQTVAIAFCQHLTGRNDTLASVSVTCTEASISDSSIVSIAMTPLHLPQGLLSMLGRARNSTPLEFCDAASVKLTKVRTWSKFQACLSRIVKLADRAWFEFWAATTDLRGFYSSPKIRNSNPNLGPQRAIIARSRYFSWFAGRCQGLHGSGGVVDGGIGVLNT